MRTRARLVGLFASLALTVILLGIPAALVAIGANPIPSSLPTLDQVRAALTRPDDGTLALQVITLLAWLAWAAFAASILLEVGSRLTGIRIPRLPALRMPQATAGRLVSAAMLLFVAAPTSTFAGTTPAHAITATAPATDTATGPATATATGPAAATSEIPTAPPAAEPAAGADPADRPSPTYTIRPGDTLSGIAARELGDASRWSDLFALNPHVGSDPDLIHPGIVLTLPDPRTARARTYTVRAGDTLSAIALRELGDADKYPLIFEASRTTLQPGGIHLSDPDQIDIGQTLTIPTAPPPPRQPPRQATPPAPPAPPPPPAAPQTPTGAEPQTPTSEEPPAAEPPAAAPSAATPTITPIPRATTTRLPGDAEATDPVDAQTLSPGWLLAGLSGSGALLAGAMLLTLRHRRATQARHRHPGRAIAPPPAPVAPVEKSVTYVGDATAPTLTYLDAALRRLAARDARDKTLMPDLVGIELTATRLVLHLAAPTDLPHPWQPGPDRRTWSLTPDTDLDEVGPDVRDTPAPYPLLVTIGASDTGEPWLLNIENHTITITGDDDFAHDLARYLAAEIACNPWSAGVDVTCLGVATEVAPINPDRIHTHDQGDTSSDPIGQALGDAIWIIDRTRDVDLDAATARAHQADEEAWPARALLIGTATDTPALGELIDLIASHPGRTATALLLRSPDTDPVGMVIDVTSDGRVLVPDLGLDLVAVGLTDEEARGCAILLAHADTETDQPIPVPADPSGGIELFTDRAGALRPEHTLPRTGHADLAPDAGGQETEGEPGPPATLLEDDDDTYTSVAATTTEDLAALAPRVPASTRVKVEAADPTLDDDIAMWFRSDSALPKLHLFGPVHATTRGKPLTKRKPYMTELLAFIALQPRGATPDEVAAAFHITGDKVRDYVRIVRQWLGTNPRTGQPHLPDARTAPAAELRGVPVYQVVDLLTDIDLFRRLRARGQARGGAAGIDDLCTALRLVHGRPFDHLVHRDDGTGWAWLLDGARLDEYLTVAIVDVAHTVTVHALAEGDLSLARTAAQTAVTAAPYEEIPRLDLAAVADAEGNHAEAARIIRDEIANRTDDEYAPPDLPDRTQLILRARRERTQDKRAS